LRLVDACSLYNVALVAGGAVIAVRVFDATTIVQNGFPPIQTQIVGAMNTAAPSLATTWDGRSTSWGGLEAPPLERPKQRSWESLGSPNCPSSLGSTKGDQWNPVQQPAVISRRVGAALSPRMPEDVVRCAVRYALSGAPRTNRTVRDMGRATHGEVAVAKLEFSSGTLTPFT